LLGVAGALALALASSAQAATVTVGQLFRPDGSCSSFTILQTAVEGGTSYAAPAAGVITSWSFQTDASPPGGLKLKVGRGAGGSNYTITAQAAAGSVAANKVNTYTANIPVQAGDMIGVYGSSGDCGTGSASSGNVVVQALGDQSPGATSPYVSGPGGKLPVSAQIVLQPGVASLSPSAGPTSGGTPVTIAGHDFTGATGVSFGGVPASSFTVNSDTTITAVVPAGTAGPADVTVTTPGGTSPVSPADGFTYLAPPVVTSVSPSRGPRTGGTQVTITGHGFTGATGVSFGGVPATSFGIVSDTMITTVAPARPAGSVDVTVATPGGQSATSTIDRFTFAPVCVVPKLKGKKLKAAKSALKHAHCGLGKVKGPKTGEVKRQSRKPGKTLPAGTKIAMKLG
jgi:hypothetical protein